MEGQGRAETRFMLAGAEILKGIARHTPVGGQNTVESDSAKCIGKNTVQGAIGKDTVKGIAKCMGKNIVKGAIGKDTVEGIPKCMRENMAKGACGAEASCGSATAKGRNEAQPAQLRARSESQ